MDIVERLRTTPTSDQVNTSRVMWLASDEIVALRARLESRDEQIADLRSQLTAAQCEREHALNGNDRW
jgi:hypothetical protein